MVSCFIDMSLTRDLVLGSRRGLGGFQFLLGLLLLVGVLLLIDHRLHRCDIILAGCKRHLSSAECDEADSNCC